MIVQLSFWLSLTALSVSARGQEISTLNSTARGLGMGDAYASLADDSSALFYNPAGLTSVREFHFTLLDVRAGIGDLATFRKLNNIKSTSGDDYATEIDSLYGDSVWSGLGAGSAVVAPGFGLSLYDHASALASVDNPVSPMIHTTVINDYGVALGLAANIAPEISTGVSLRYIKRTGADLPFGAAFLADLDPKVIFNNVNVWGRGLALDVGVNWRGDLDPGEWIFSTVWRNVGQTRFKSNTPSVVLPYDDNDLVAAGALKFDFAGVRVAPAVDLNYLTLSSIPWTRKINFGLQLGNALVDIRGGFREGYYTYGAGVDLGLFILEAASYGVELGAYPGQIEDRRYMAEISFGLGLDGRSNGPKRRR